MKRLLLTLFFLFFVASLAFAQGNSRGVFVEGQGRKFAVLIGVNDYANMRKLRYAKNDVTAIRDQLYKIGFEKENVFCLVCGGTENERPSKDNILTTILHATELTQEGDILLIAMAGHGVETNEGQARFCGVDANPGELLTTTVPIGDIFEAVGQCKASFKLMMIDACRDDPFRGRAAFGAKTIDTLDNPPKGALLFQSSAKGEISLEDDDTKQGIFSYYVAEGLSGKAADKEGRVTLLGLSAYVIEQTRRRAFALETRRQVPYLKGEITDFVIANIPVTPPIPIRPVPTTTQAQTFTTLPLPNPAEVPPIPDGRRINVSTVSRLLEAVKNAQDGDVIVLAPGTYNLSKDFDIRNKRSIVLYGDPKTPQNVKITLNGEDGGLKRIGISSTTFSRLIGLDISGCVHVFSSRTDILFCSIHNQADQTGRGAEGFSNATIVVANSVIANNNYVGLYIAEGSLTINNCLITENGGDGIESGGTGGSSVNITVTDSDVIGNDSSGISVRYKNNVATVSGCKIRDNEHAGIYISQAASGEFRNNTLSNNKFKDWHIDNAGKITRIDNIPNE